MGRHRRGCRPAVPRLHFPFVTMPTTVSEEQQLQDLNQRMLGKSKPEQADILRGYMKDELGVKAEERAPVAQFTDEQFSQLTEAVASETRKVAEVAANDLQKKYDLSRGDSRAIVEDSIAKTLRENDRR